MENVGAGEEEEGLATPEDAADADDGRGTPWGGTQLPITFTDHYRGYQSTRVDFLADPLRVPEWTQRPFYLLATLKDLIWETGPEARTPPG